MLDERQKEMMELCKSESEEEELNENLAEHVNGTTEKEEETEAVKNVKEDLKGTTEALKDPETVIGDTADNETFNSNSVEVADINSPNHLNNNNKEHELDSTENHENEVSTVQNTEQIYEEQDSETSMKLVYNDSANSTMDDLTDVQKEDVAKNVSKVASNNATEVSILSDTHESEMVHDSAKVNSERDSQLISLHLNSENTDCSNIKKVTDSAAKDSIDNSTVNNNTKSVDQEVTENAVQSSDIHTETGGNNLEDNNIQKNERSGENKETEVDNEFSDDDMNMEDIDNIIENAEIIKGMSN